MTVQELLVRLQEYRANWEIYNKGDALVICDPNDPENCDEIDLDNFG